MSTRGWHVTLLASAFAGWVGGAAGMLAYLNWFSETSRTGGGIVWAASWTALLVGLGATVAFFSLAAFELADRMRGHA
jgi:hypothetical protein